MLDDGSPAQNGDPTLYPAGGLSAENTIRAGDTITGITGVLDQRHGDYRIEPLEVGEFVATNARTDAPESLGGRLVDAITGLPLTGLGWLRRRLEARQRNSPLRRSF